MECKCFKCIAITGITVGLIVFTISSILNKFFYATVLNLSVYFAEATVIVFFGLVVWLGMEIYFYVKNGIYGYYEAKKQELENTYNALKADKEQELKELERKIEQYIKTNEDIDAIKQSTEILFNEVLNKCYRYISTKETLIEELKIKKGKQLNFSLKNNMISEKGAAKAMKKFEKMLDEVKALIEQEKEGFDYFVFCSNDLIRKIEKLKMDKKT